MVSIEPTVEHRQGMNLQGRLIILEQILTDLLTMSEYRPSILLRASDYLAHLRQNLNAQDPENAYLNEMLEGAQGCLERIERASD